MRKIAITLAMLFAFTACGGQVTEGEVVDKVFKEESVEQREITETVCENEKKTTGTGKKRKTKTVRECEDEPTGEFEDVTIPAEYTLVLENDEGDRGEVDVSEEEYNSVEIGEFYGRE